ncbi:hypothetical protein BG004_000968, partial [Podila humilis]
MDMILNSSWARKGTSDNDPSKEQRRKQIESLLTELPTVRPVPNDDSRFQMTLNLSNSSSDSNNSASSQLARTTSSQDIRLPDSKNTAVMTIYLPPAFPDEEPKITIQPTVRHLWVDGTVQPSTVTGHERLMPGGWSSHANLGRIVKEISNTIQWTGVLPPPPIPGPRSQSLGQPSSSSGMGPLANTSHQQQQHTGIGSGGSLFGGLSKATSTPNSFIGQSTEAKIVMQMSAEQLEELLESPIAFQHFVDHLEVVVNSKTLRSELWLGNDNVS